LRLKETRDPLNEIYARCGLLVLELKTNEAGGPDDRTLAEIADLSRAISQLQLPPLERQTFVRELARLREQEQNRATGKVALKQFPLPVNPIPPDDPLRPLAFHPIPELRAEWLNWIKCTDALDVMWSPMAIYAMSTKGDVRKIFPHEDLHDAIHFACWDGKNIWVATANSGVWALAPSGKVVSQISTSEGLPPYDATLPPGAYRPDPKGEELKWIGLTEASHRSPRPLLLHPVGPDRCIVLGRFGAQQRQWLAMISQPQTGESKFAVNVFHTMTNVSKADVNAADDDASEMFDVSWLADYQSLPPKQRPLLLVGRRYKFSRHVIKYEDKPTPGEFRRPLAIDLETLKVSILPGYLPSATTFTDGHNILSQHGRLLIAYRYGLELHSPPLATEAAEAGDWRHQLLEGLSLPDHPDMFCPTLLDFGGEIYLPGNDWCRIDPENFEVKHLSPYDLPHRQRFSYHAVSAHYGLVAWRFGDCLHQVILGEEALGQRETADSYQSVPADQRQRHFAAVQTIRQLGGSVDMEWNIHRREMSTIVYLSDSWQGGDEGLKQLQDLYHLQTLQLVRANVTDAGC
jgi:hypothetical protein